VQLTRNRYVPPFDNIRIAGGSAREYDAIELLQVIGWRRHHRDYWRVCGIPNVKNNMNFMR
jgi:hypothetical protein